MSGDGLTLSIENNLAEISRVATALSSFFEQRQLSPKTLMEVNLCLEELLINTISYGYRDQAQHFIRLVIALKDDSMEIELTDDGRHFNPLESPPADVTSPLVERRVGGLGIQLVKNLMDRVEYARKDEQNIVLLTKKVQRLPGFSAPSGPV